MPSTQTRAHVFNDKADVVAEGEFALSAYFKDNNAEYFTDAWVYYFVSDDGLARWRFRDVVNQDYLIDLYWPDGVVDFMAYVPRKLEECAATISNLSYDSTAGKGISFDATTNAVINDRTEQEREQENAKSEFMFATHLNQSKSTGGTVRLRFVHPFAAVKFRLHQSHRDLVINSITLHGLDRSGSFKCDASTYEPYKAGNNGQDYITYSNWTTNNSGELTVNLSKSVPGDINYQSQIGGPYMVIPQSLDDIKLSVNYSWNSETKQSAQFSISTAHVPNWQPGKIYTYTLDLGDNKEEILFKVVVEEWTNGEEDGFENNYDVQ